MTKPILALDFDGVIHSYKSGWKGARSIPDPPVPGALEFIVSAMEAFDVQIFSSRSRYFGARRAMKRWLLEAYMDVPDEVGDYYDECPTWFVKAIIGPSANLGIGRKSFIVMRILNRLKFPIWKPPAMVTLDDRAITFTGVFPTVEKLKAFKPWNKIFIPCRKCGAPTEFTGDPRDGVRYTCPPCDKPFAKYLEPVVDITVRNTPDQPALVTVVNRAGVHKIRTSDKPPMLPNDRPVG